MNKKERIINKIDEYIVDYSCGCMGSYGCHKERIREIMDNTKWNSGFKETKDL